MLYGPQRNHQDLENLRPTYGCKARMMTPENLPSLRDVYSAAEREELFLLKLKVCSVIYDFSNDSDLVGKETKRYYLQDIVEFVTQCKGVFTERTLRPFMSMVSVNILRALPVGSSTDELFDLEEDEPSLEASWPHLQLVYELLRKFIVSSDSESPTARSLITPRFVFGIVDLFNSEDPREREYLKTILHRIYGKVMPLRTPIRRAIAFTFFRVVHERVRHNGVSELLEILGSIINGFSIPLKEEHKFLLRRALLPLHSAQTMPQFHTQLSFCVTQFVSKEPSLAPEVLKELVRHWPVVRTRKQVLFLNELEEVIELAQATEASAIVVPLFKQLAQCTRSLHFQVAERVLYFWHNQSVVALFEQYRRRLMPIFVGAVHENIKSHWNVNVKNLSYHVQTLLCELDTELFEECMKKYQLKQVEAETKNIERVQRWRELDALADRRRRARSSTSMPNLASVAAGIAAPTITKTAHQSMDDLTMMSPTVSPSQSSSLGSVEEDDAQKVEVMFIDTSSSASLESRMRAGRIGSTAARSVAQSATAATAVSVNLSV